jgi:hypothetical protein
MWKVADPENGPGPARGFNGGGPKRKAWASAGRASRPLGITLAVPVLFAGAVLIARGSTTDDLRMPYAANGRQALLVSPRAVVPGGPLRVLAASEEAIRQVALTVDGPDGALKAADVRASGGGPPFWWAAEFTAGTAGLHRVRLTAGGKSLIDTEIEVGPARASRVGGASAWRTELPWERGTENLYSAWLELLFLEANERDSWNPLHEVTREPRRNILHDHLGLGEDGASGPGALRMKPDCADNPFFFRAYFAWKMGLAFGYRVCSRGTLARPPFCETWTTNESARGRGNEARIFQGFLGGIMNAVHSGSPRTPLADDATDLYPVALTRNTLRPGTVFADPYGHTLTIVRWVPQTDDAPGRLLAVDAEPDGTIGIKRFWRGNFLFETDRVIGEPGFKAFRPVVRERGLLRALANAALATSGDFAPFSLEQRGLAKNAFYDRMEALINPDRLDPETAYLDLHRALHELLLVRVLSVGNGLKHARENPGAIVPMPRGRGVFQAAGPWEDFSTPNRDMRLLIAMDAVADFPEKVFRTPDLYRQSKRTKPEVLKRRLLDLHAKWSAEMTIAYERSDGSPRTLTLEDVLARREAFEMGYNPNDGPEIRWGAPEGSDEMTTCRRRAPAEQRRRMLEYRDWFRARRFPVE